MSDEFECPYCSHAWNLDADDYGRDGETMEATCPECEKHFIYQVSWRADVECWEADCLNGAEHSWRDYLPDPYYSKYLKTYKRCTVCDREEKVYLSKEERETLGDTNE